MRNPKLPPPPPACQRDTDEFSDTVPLMQAATAPDTWPLFRAAEPIPPKDEQH